MKPQLLLKFQKLAISVSGVTFLFCGIAAVMRSSILLAVLAILNLVMFFVNIRFYLKDKARFKNIEPFLKKEEPVMARMNGDK